MQNLPRNIGIAGVYSNRQARVVSRNHNQCLLFLVRRRRFVGQAMRKSLFAPQNLTEQDNIRNHRQRNVSHGATEQAKRQNTDPVDVLRSKGTR